MKKEDEETTNDIPFKPNLHQKKPELPPPANPTRKQQSTENTSMMGRIGDSRYNRTQRNHNGCFSNVVDVAKMKSGLLETPAKIFWVFGLCHTPPANSWNSK